MIRTPLWLLAAALLPAVAFGQQPPAPPSPDTPTPERRRPVAPAYPPDAPKATLRGHVYAQDTGAPLRRAQVSLRPERRQGEPTTVLTDAQGSFEFRNVEPGTYQLSCSRNGYVTASYGQQAPSRPPAPLTVAPGQEIKDLEFRLIPGGVISGTVTDEEGEPLPHVMVHAMTRQYTRGQARLYPRSSATTDDRGMYRIFNLPPGRYFVQAAQQGTRDGRFAPLLYPGVTTPRDAQRVEVTGGGETARVDFRLREVPAFSVSGRVVDQLTGEPLRQGAVTIQPEDGTFGSAGYRQVRQDGGFRVEGLLPGRYRLMVMVPQRDSNTMARPFVKAFEIGGADVENLLIAVGPGATVRGRVRAEGGEVPPELRLYLSSRALGPGPGGGSAPLRADLTFEFQNVQPGDYLLNVMSPSGGQAPAGPPFYVAEVRSGSANVVDTGLTVPEAGPPPELEVMLRFDGGAVAGRVTTDSGEPLSGVQIVLVAADAERRALDRYFRSAAPDQNGNYALRGVIPGDYLLVVWPGGDAGGILDPDLFSQLQRYATSVTVGKSASASKDLKLAPEVQTIARNASQ